VADTFSIENKRKFLDLINGQIKSNTESTPKRPKRDDAEWLFFVKNQCMVDYKTPNREVV
jgi:hypothetical protein